MLQSRLLRCLCDLERTTALWLAEFSNFTWKKNGRPLRGWPGGLTVTEEGTAWGWYQELLAILSSYPLTLCSQELGHGHWEDLEMAWAVSILPLSVCGAGAGKEVQGPMRNGV